jgi:single-stranded DNA-binding protein
MAADAGNNGTLICGVVSIELAGQNENIAKFRVAKDYAGKDAKDPEDRRGFFDVVLYEDESDPNNKFVFGQIRGGKMKKGSQIAINYRLNNPRWSADDGSGRQKVELVANAINYVGSKRDDDESSSESDEPVEAVATQSASSSASSGSGGVPQKF